MYADLHADLLDVQGRFADNVIAAPWEQACEGERGDPCLLSFETQKRQKDFAMPKPAKPRDPKGLSAHP
jgi:hypothetical protein